jgi:hypothetical protein
MFSLTLLESNDGSLILSRQIELWGVIVYGAVRQYGAGAAITVGLPLLGVLAEP